MLYPRLCCIGLFVLFTFRASLSGNVEVIEHLINKVNFSTKNAFIQVPTKIKLTFLKKKSFILFVFAYLLFYLFYLIILWEGGGSMNNRNREYLILSYNKVASLSFPLPG